MEYQLKDKFHAERMNIMCMYKLCGEVTDLLALAKDIVDSEKKIFCDLTNFKFSHGSRSFTAFFSQYLTRELLMVATIYCLYFALRQNVNKAFCVCFYEKYIYHQIRLLIVHYAMIDL